MNPVKNILFETIVDFSAILNGERWRAISDERTVHVQKMHYRDLEWETVRTMQVDEFRNYAESVNLFGEYTFDPGLLARLQQQQVVAP